MDKKLYDLDTLKVMTGKLGEYSKEEVTTAYVSAIHYRNENKKLYKEVEGELKKEVKTLEQYMQERFDDGSWDKKEIEQLILDLGGEPSNPVTAKMVSQTDAVIKNSTALKNNLMVAITTDHPEYSRYLSVTVNKRNIIKDGLAGNLPDSVEPHVDIITREVITYE